MKERGEGREKKRERERMKEREQENLIHTNSCKDVK